MQCTGCAAPRSVLARELRTVSVWTWPLSTTAALPTFIRLLTICHSTYFSTPFCSFPLSLASSTLLDSEDKDTTTLRNGRQHRILQHLYDNLQCHIAKHNFSPSPSFFVLSLHLFPSTSNAYRPQFCVLSPTSLSLSLPLARCISFPQLSAPTGVVQLSNEVWTACVLQPGDQLTQLNVTARRYRCLLLPGLGNKHKARLCVSTTAPRIWMCGARLQPPPTHLYYVSFGTEEICL